MVFQQSKSQFRHSQNTSTKNVSLTLPEISLNSKVYPFTAIDCKTQWYDKVSIKYTMNTQNIFLLLTHYYLQDHH